MTTALENAVNLQLQKQAQDQAQEQGLTPMQMGYLDAMSKLGYELKESAGPTGAPTTPMASKPAGEVTGPGLTPPPNTKGKPVGTGGFKGHVQNTLKRPGAAPAAPAFGGRRSRGPGG